MTNDEKEIRQLEDEVHEAFLKADIATLDRILSDDFLFVDPAGTIATKSDWIADIQSGAIVYELVRIDELIVRLFGDAAVTHGRVSMRGRLKNEGAFEERYSYTTTYVRTDGRWQVVAEQAGILQPG